MMEFKFGNALIKEEGATIEYGPYDQEHKDDGINWVWVERRVPEELRDAINQLISYVIESNGYNDE